MNNVHDEDAVSFMDETGPRLLRGIIIAEDENFITLRRREGDIKIATNRVIKIFYRKKR